MKLNMQALLLGLTLSCIIVVIDGIELEEKNKRISKSDELVEVGEKNNAPCQNILKNLTKGTWMSRVSEQGKRRREAFEKILDRRQTAFRIQRGIHTQLTRDDNKCGYRNFQKKPKNNPWGKKVGSWCEASSDKPCCSDAMNGTCGLNCNCTECVDMRRIKHAEVSDWIPDDNRCTMKKYRQKAACGILKRFSQLHITGDSFPRKMARGLVLTLRSDRNHGALLDHYGKSLESLCRAQGGMYWKVCSLLHGSIRSQLRDKKPFCEGDDFEMYFQELWGPNHGSSFLELITNLTQVPGSVVAVGVGHHMQCDVQKTIKYLHPSIEYLKSYYNTATLEWNAKSPTWPHIIYMYPDLPGLLKPVIYHRRRGREPCNAFAEEMKKYCDQHGIAVLDFRGLTTGVHSYDGTHYGLGVNLMKAQILLNYLDSLDKKI